MKATEIARIWIVPLLRALFWCECLPRWRIALQIYAVRPDVILEEIVSPAWQFCLSFLDAFSIAARKFGHAGDCRSSLRDRLFSAGRCNYTTLKCTFVGKTEKKKQYQMRNRRKCLAVASMAKQGMNGKKQK